MSVFRDLGVVDFTGELGPYAARLFAGLGADVIHLEPIDGDPLRTRGPFYRNEPGRDRSLAFLYYNAGKRGLALDLGNAPGRQIFRHLCGQAGLLIESTAPGYLESLGLGFEALRQSNQRLVQTSISLFGHSGPYRTLPGSDITCSALGGFLFLGGVGDDKPVRACDNQAFRMAEAYGAAASAAAVLYAQRTGTGQFVDVSCQESAATALENAPQYYDLEGKIRRGRGREAGNGTIHPCRDGYVVLVAVMGRNKAMWDAFVGWMKHAGVEEWQTFEDEKWIEPDFRSSAEGYESFCRIFERYAAKHAKMCLYETGQRQRVAVSPVSNGRDLLENPQLRHRHFWRQMHHERLGGNVTFPGAPVRFSGSHGESTRPPPPLGSIPKRSSGNWDTRRGTFNPWRNKESCALTGRWFVTAERRSLEGIVVCDFAWVGAGSITTSLMAQLGAEVIKIETAARPDVLRLSGPFKDGVARGLERSGYFASRNPNKKSVALNMTHPDARAVALDLITRSDVVINNFRVGQMEKWGLGWDDLRGGNPRLIYVTMSLQGAAGPHSAFMGFGVNLNALSGLTVQSAFPGKRPFGTGTHYTDHVMVPAHTLFGILAALADREETGLGQMVEVSQLEAAICMKPLDAMAWSANRDILGPIGFGDPDAAPHGVFSTLCPEAHRHQKQNRRGDGLCPTQTAGGVLKSAPRSAPTSEHSCKWVAITVFTEREWGALKRVMGQPPWAEEPRFGTIQARKASEQELNARLEDWTNRHTAGELVEKLVGAGVSAGIVHDARGVIEDGNLTERGFWCYLDHPEMGRTLYNRAPFILSETPAALRTAAPLLGQHTREVLTAILGFTEAEVNNLRSRGVLG